MKMNEKVYNLTIELKKEMDNDPRFLLLDELEQKINISDEVALLAYKKDRASDKYNDLLKIYKEDDEIVIRARKNLIKAKDELDAHPLVKSYLKAYNEVRLLLYEVNNILFKDYKGKVC